MTLPAGIKRVFSVDGGFLVDVSNNVLGFTFNGVDRFFMDKKGTSTNDDAAAGDIGEYLETTVAIGDAVSETTATAVDVCTLALTPGDWEVSATVDRALGAVTAWQYSAGISLTANTMPTQAGGSGIGSDPAIVQTATFGATTTGNYVTAIPPVRVKLAANATIHLVAADTFSAGTVGVFGTLRARRVAH